MYTRVPSSRFYRIAKRKLAKFQLQALPLRIGVSDVLFFIFEENTLSEVFVMHTRIKTSFLFYTFTLFMCLNSFFLRNTDCTSRQ